MSDQFYGSLDRECLRNDFNPERKSDYRSIFHQDRDRILFTPAFRRLQAKTQVFQAGEYDFYRTRLTHSLEVSRIAESIAVWRRCRSTSICWRESVSRTTSGIRRSAMRASAR
jgi:dGTPase